MIQGINILPLSTQAMALQLVFLFLVLQLLIASKFSNIFLHMAEYQKQVHMCSSKLKSHNYCLGCLQ